AGAGSSGGCRSVAGCEYCHLIFNSSPITARRARPGSASNPNIVWAGTGEAWAIRDSDLMGNGIYKSTDAGKHWTHTGLDETGRIGRIIVDPANSQIVYVCAMGRLTGPQQERGVYKTTDGGRTWDRVLFADESSGCSGLSMDPQNSSILFAGMWQGDMHPWGLNSGGPGSGVFMSRDFGATWTRITGHGLPHSPVGKIDRSEEHTSELQS